MSIIKGKPESANGDTNFLDLTLGITQTLEKRKGVIDVKLAKKTGVERSQVLTWEQRFSCIMPEDLKNFYLTSNGLLLTWSVKMNDCKIPLGKMEINTLEKLIRLGSATSYVDKHIPNLGDISDSDDDSDGEDNRPKFDHRSRVFEIDSCDGYGKVCYVYNNTKPGIPAQKAEVWFLDRSLQWHFLADTFLNYFRLMLTHLGLPHWQYAFTDIGVPPQSQQWFNLYRPIQLQQEQDPVSAYDLTGADTTRTHQFSADKVFRGKLDKKKSQTQAAVTQTLNNRKKVPGTSSSTRPSTNGLTRPFTQGLANKPNR